jgi:hypothetical protein
MMIVMKEEIPPTAQSQLRLLLQCLDILNRQMASLVHLYIYLVPASLRQATPKGV